MAAIQTKELIIKKKNGDMFIVKDYVKGAYSMPFVIRTNRYPLSDGFRRFIDKQRIFAGCGISGYTPFLENKPHGGNAIMEVMDLSARYLGLAGKDTLALLFDKVGNLVGTYGNLGIWRDYVHVGDKIITLDADGNFAEKTADDTFEADFINLNTGTRSKPAFKKFVFPKKIDWGSLFARFYIKTYPGHSNNVWVTLFQKPAGIEVLERKNWD